MTLKGYYERLLKEDTPSNKFLKDVAERCEVSTTTVRNWCLYNIRPQRKSCVRVLSELSGIEEEELWGN